MDRSGLAEALTAADKQFSLGLTPYLLQSNPILEAARAVLNSEEVDWCKTHGSKRASPSEWCQLVYLVEAANHHDPPSCHMIPRLLIDLETK